MMKRTINRWVCTLAALLCLCALIPAAHAEGENPPVPAVVSTPKVTGYTVTASGLPVTRISKGDAVSVAVTVEDKDVMTAQIPGILDTVPNYTALVISGASGSFAGAAPRIEVQSMAAEPLKLLLTFENCVYQGKGSALKFTLAYQPFAELAPAKLACSIAECVEEPPTPPIVPDTPEPRLQITRSELKGPIAGGESVALTLTIKNLSATAAIRDVLVSVTPSEGLMLEEGSSSFPLDEIPAQKAGTLTLHVKALSAITSQAQYLDVGVRFRYDGNDGAASATVSEKIPIQAKVTPTGGGGGGSVPVDSPVPNVIVSGYRYGDSMQIPVGSGFTLEMEFFNTSDKLNIENLTMMLEPAEGLAMNGSTNTFYYAAMDKQQKIKERIPMMVLATAKNSVQEITVTFKYEYVDHRKRTQVTLTQKLSVPIYQPDRFEVTAPVLPPSVNAGEEVTVAFPYYNKGRSDVMNVSATLEGDIAALSRVQNVGNLEPGKTGTFDFILTPYDAGEVSASVTVNYETSTGEQKTKTFPLTLTVAEAPVEEPIDDGMMPEEEAGKPAWLPMLILIAASLLTAGVVATLIVRAVKKRRGSRQETEFRWEDDDRAGGGGHENT